MKKIKELVMKNQKAVTCGVVTGTALVGTPVFANDLGTITSSLTDFLTELGTHGITIIVAVIAFALIFVGARWLWGMFKQWLSGAR